MPERPYRKLQRTFTEPNRTSVVMSSAKSHRTMALADEEVEDGRWVTSDGYSDNVLRTKTGEVLIRTGIESKTLGMSPGFYTSTSRRATWSC